MKSFIPVALSVLLNEADQLSIEGVEETGSLRQRRVDQLNEDKYDGTIEAYRHTYQGGPPSDTEQVHVPQ